MNAQSIGRQFVAEWLGTLMLLVTVIGSGIMAERLAGGNIAIALLGNTIATGAILVVLITVFGPVSGAHFNPAVTLAFAIRKEISPSMALLYILFQIMGAVCGAMLAHFMFEVSLLQISQNVRSGPAQMGSEAVATFGLVMVIFGGIRFRPDAVPWLVGLYITAAYWFTSSTSFANPAVTLARSLTDSFSGIRPVDAPGFIISQLVAAMIATYVLGWLFGNKAEPRS
ncbi:MIP/aquaporin family protein [Candidatus Puniceispirillum marinum]|uniref:Major intrinsic protein n=1 Tax=Puniceispirillum marinum (strain IMCC1322) TaxID=488538 RepID=D5BN49_PUNMI|nr:MIP/aquaporin family protein [Candidatus Puniceispirillum marinum]ADE40242.1 major intrinsic protein [Candidatus Puniceispirillum marinum IMCC1322]